jgi:hypothetical protein
MKQDKFNKSIYWHGGKMFFTGGAMMDFMKNNRSELPSVDNTLMAPRGGTSVQSSMPGIMNTPVAGLQPSSDTPSTPKESNFDASSVAGLAGMGAGLVSAIGKPGGKGTALASGVLSGAAAGASLGPIGMVGGAAIGGITGLLGANSTQKVQKLEDERIQREQYAAGTANRNPYGSIYANGGSFSNGGITPRLTTFDEGGTHEENPNSGVQQGINADGQPNLVEQGESKFKDYIYSARLPLVNASEYSLPKGLSGKTFAEASKKISKSVEERPNDVIAKAGQDSALNRLKQANDDAIEIKKFSDENEQFKCGGKMKMGKNKFEYGGYIFNDI